MKSWIAALTFGLFAAQCGLADCGYAATRPATYEQAPAPPAPPPPNDVLSPAGQQPGGIVPCLLTCYLGPRAGLEYNEGRKIATIEWIELLVMLVPFAGPLLHFGIILVMDALPAMNGKTMSEWVVENQTDTRPIPPPAGGPSATKGGFLACLTACCLSPRVSYERNESRKIRTKELLLLIPIVNIVFIILIGLEAFNGKTMTQVALEEGLDVPTPAPAQ